MNRADHENVKETSGNTYLKELLRDIPDSVLEKSNLGEYAKIYMFQMKYGDPANFSYQMSKNDLAFVLHALIKNEVELNDDTLEKLRKLLFEIDDSLILKSKCSRAGIEYLLYQKYGEHRVQAAYGKTAICIDFITIKSNSIAIEGNIKWNIFSGENVPEIFAVVGEHRYAAKVVDRVEKGKLLGAVVSKVLEFQTEIPIEAADSSIRIDFYIGVDDELKCIKEA